MTDDETTPTAGGGTAARGAAPPAPPVGTERSAGGTSIGTGRPDGPAVGWTELLVAAPLYLLLTAGAGLVLFLVAGGAALGSAVPLLALTGACTLAVVFAVLAIRVRWLPAIGLRRTTVGWLLGGIAVGLVCRVLGFGVGWSYQQLTGDLSNPQAFLGEALVAGGGLEIAAVMLTGALLVPFAEELLFRGIGYGALRRYGVAVALPASAAVFAVAHGINVVLPIAFVLGVACALLYERTRSIWPAVVTHATFNAAGFAIAVLFL